MKTENRFSPSPAAWRNQATLRHPERSTYRCFLTDLAGFIDVCRAGPDCAKRQDRKKTGLFHSSLSSYHYPRLESCCDLSEWRLPEREDSHRYWHYGRREFSELRCVRCAVR